ncbi:proteasome assembly chaperone 4-like, partial [Scleropages formosus]
GACFNGETAEEAISIHNFSEKILEQAVHFHVMKMRGGFFLWDSMPLSTLLLGDPSDTTSSSLAQRLAKKTKKQVFVSYSLPSTDSNLILLVEKRIKKEMELFPEKF